MEPFRDSTAVEAVAQDMRNRYPSLIAAMSRFDIKTSSPPTLIVEDPAPKQNASIESGEDWCAKRDGHVQGMIRPSTLIA